MGQNYTWFKIKEDKKLESYISGGGGKLLESTGFYDVGTLSIMRLINNNPSRLAFIGCYWDDYLEQGDVEEVRKKLKNYEKELTEYFSTLFEKDGNKQIPIYEYVSLEKEKLREDHDAEGFYERIGFDVKNTYIVNHTKKERIKIMDPRIGEKMLENPSRYYSFPLVVLMAVGSGMGGGDFTETNRANKPELTGHWAFDVVESSTNPKFCDEYVDKTIDYTFTAY